MIKFISPDVLTHRYIKFLSKFLDIKYSVSEKEILESDRYLIIWNPYGYLVYNSPIYRLKYKLYKKLSTSHRVFVVERGAFPNTIFIDNTGFNVESSFYDAQYWDSPLTTQQKEEITNYLNFYKYDISSLEPQKNNRLTRKDFFSRLDITKNYKRVVFIPLQIHNDTTIILWADWVKSIQNFISLISVLAERFPDVLFLVKNHPQEKEVFFKGSQSNIRLVDNFHFKDCIAYSDLVLTINSGVGVQSLAWNKPVGVLGKAFYDEGGLVTKLNNFEEIEDFINDPVYPSKGCLNFLHYLIFKYYTHCKIRNLGNNISEPYYMNKVIIHSLEKPIIPKLSVEHKPKVLYLFNEYGWAFHFEALNYKKFSELDVVPLKVDLNNISFSLSEIKKQNPDIVVFPSAMHLHKFKTHFSELAKYAIVCQYNSHFELKFPTFNNLDLVIVSSLKLYNSLKSYYKDLIYLPHWVDIDFFKRRYKYHNFVVGWIGNFFNKEKRTDWLFQLGYPILIKSNYKGFLNKKSDHRSVLDFYDKIDVLLITSKTEGTPMPLLEASASKKCILSTDVGIASEILDKWAIVRDVNEMKTKLKYLEDHPDFLKRQAEKNYEVVNKKFSYKSNAHILDEIYSNLLNHKSEQLSIKKENIPQGTTIQDLVTRIAFLAEEPVVILKNSCKEAVMYGEIKSLPLYLDLKHQKILSNLLSEEDLKNIEFTQGRYTKTKPWQVYGNEVRVPFPVIKYLVRLYGVEIRTQLRKMGRI